MATLTGERIKDTYDGLLKLKDSQALTSSNKVITDGLDNDTALSISSIGVEVNGGTTLNGATEATGEVEVNVTDLANTATEGIRIDLNKNSAGTGYSTKTIALETLANNQGTAQYYATNGIRSVSQHTGTGDGYFLSGVISTTTNEGSGSLAALYGTYTTLNSNGTGVQDVDYMIGNTISMNFNNPNLDVNRVGAINAQLNFNEATTINTEAYVMLLDVDFTGVTGTDIPVGGDFAYLFIKPHTATDIVSTTGSARAINSESTLPSRFAGDMHFEGNVGIGTTSPSEKLEVADTNQPPVIRLNRDKNLSGTNWVGESLGDIEFYTSDTSGAQVYAKISAVGGLDSGVPNSGVPDGDLVFYNRDHGSTLDESMRINSLGNVGIGTTSPSYSLHVDSGDVETIAYFKSSDNRGRISIADDDTTSYIISEGSKMSLGTVASLNTSNLTIDSSGKVGIGTTSPSYALDIVGSLNNIAKLTSSTTKSQLLFVDSDSTDTVAIGSQGDDFNVRVDNGDINLKTGSGATATTRVKINSSGNVGIGTTSPSEKLEVVGDAKMTGTLNVGPTTDYADNAAALLAG